MAHNKTRVVGGFILAAFVATLCATAEGRAASGQISRVEAFDTDIWTIWTTSGSNQVVVDGDGDTDLDCYVYDLSGQLLGKDDDATDYCIVDFYRRRSGNVKVHIVNLGTVWNRYELSVF